MLLGGVILVPMIATNFIHVQDLNYHINPADVGYDGFSTIKDVAKAA